MDVKKKTVKCTDLKETEKCNELERTEKSNELEKTVKCKSSKKTEKSNDLTKNLSDATASILLNCEEPLPHTKQLLKDKPHLCLLKNVEIDDALRELNKFVSTLTDRLMKSEGIEELNQIAEILSAIVILVRESLDFADSNKSVIVYKIVPTLTNLLGLDVCPKLKGEVAFLGEQFLHFSGDDNVRIIEIIGASTLNYLLDLTLGLTGDKTVVKKCDIKRVWSLHKVIDKLDLFIDLNSGLLQKLMSTITNNNYLKQKEGVFVIGHLMRRDLSLVKKVHQIILSYIPKISRSLSAGYGTVYYSAWNASEGVIRQEIEDCIQDIMQKVIYGPRGGFDMQKANANAFAILCELHEERKKKPFSHILNQLYTAILWRNLQSDDPWKRCNAAQVFFDVFPLEKPYCTAHENNDYIERQLNTIKKLLLDDSHYVRVISIRGFCSKLPSTIGLISMVQLKEISAILFDLLPSDTSSYMTRKTLFEGLEHLLGGRPDNDTKRKNPCQALVESMLKCVTNSFYDENEKVRKAFVKMLIKVKEQSQTLDIQYWHVIPLPQILEQLAVEGPDVGETIGKLIKHHVYRNRDTNKFITRLVKMFSWDIQGTKNFFCYSKRVLDTDEAYSVIVNLIGGTRIKIKEFLECLNNKNYSTTSSQSDNNKAGAQGALLDISNKIEDMSGSPGNILSSRDPIVSAIFADRPHLSILGDIVSLTNIIQVASTTWVVFCKELNARPELMDNLYLLACNSVPLILSHYKDTPVYYAMVNFASLIPIAKLRPVSTISSACMSELKKVTDATDPSKLECLIYSLCSWNLGNDVLELASEWFNFAFREQNLNNTAVTKAGGQKKKARVRFQQKDGKPLLALKLLDILFSDVVNETRILNKNYEQLHDFYSSLEKIVIILERKLKDPVSFNKPDTCLTDEFIYKAYCRYIRLMLSLHRLDVEKARDSVPPFDAALTSTNTINFASTTMLPHIPQEDCDEPPLAAKCCLAVLNEATMAVGLGYTNEAHSHALCLFVNDLLSQNNAVWFLESAIKTIPAVAEHVQFYMPNDDWNLVSKILPSLMEKVLNILTDLDTSTPPKTIFKDLKSLRPSLFRFLLIVLQQHGEQSELFQDVFRTFIHTCILIVQQRIIDEDEVNFHKKIDDHPYFVALIIRNIYFKARLSPHLIPAILYHVKMFSQEGYKLLSCLSILYTVIFFTNGNKNSMVLEEALQTTYELTMSYKPKEKSVQDDDFSSTSSVNIDVKKVSEPIFQELSNHLQCSLCKIDVGSTVP